MSIYSNRALESQCDSSVLNQNKIRKKDTPSLTSQYHKATKSSFFLIGEIIDEPDTLLWIQDVFVPAADGWSSPFLLQTPTEHAHPAASPYSHRNKCKDSDTFLLPYRTTNISPNNMGLTSAFQLYPSYKQTNYAFLT